MDIATFLYARIREDACAAWERPAEPSSRRVLVECETKWRLLSLHQPEQASGPPGGYRCRHDQQRAGRWPCPTVQILALPYAAHPDYRQDWAVLPAAGGPGRGRGTSLHRPPAGASR